MNARVNFKEHLNDILIYLANSLKFYIG